MTFTVRHGIDGPNRNRWYTPFLRMVDLSMANCECHNQMVVISLGNCSENLGKITVAPRRLNHRPFFLGDSFGNHTRDHGDMVCWKGHIDEKTWEHENFIRICQEQTDDIRPKEMFHPPKDHVVFWFLFAGIKQHIMGVFNNYEWGMGWSCWVGEFSIL